MPFVRHAVVAHFVEVKWARQLRPEELEEIGRRGHGVVAAKVDAPAEIDGVTVLPAALVLLRLATLSAPTRA